MNSKDSATKINQIYNAPDYLQSSEDEKGENEQTVCINFDLTIRD